MKGRFFVTLDPERSERAYLDAEVARHLRALRLTRGDRVSAIVAPGCEREAVIERFEGERVVLTLAAPLPAAGRDPVHPRTLAIALGDFARMDLVIEKATELGATAVQPFVAERSQARLVTPTRLERWRRIARSASEQCGRTLVPDIRACIDFAAVVAGIRPDEIVWLLSPGTPGEEAASSPVSLSPASEFDGESHERGTQSLLLVVGPEGGLSQDESARLIACGARRVTLGRRVLRFETAAIAALVAATVCFPEGR